MGYDTTRFIGEVDDEFHCSICSMVLEDPVQTSCDHSFCNGCITEWLTLNAICPVDRQPLATTDLKSPGRLMRNLLPKLKIKCDNHLEGCRSVIRLGKLQDHLTSCEYNPNVDVTCDKGCTLKKRRREQITAQPPKWQKVDGLIISTIQPHILKGEGYKNGFAQLCYPLTPSNPSFKVEIVSAMGMEMEMEMEMGMGMGMGMGIGLTSLEAGSAGSITYNSQGFLNNRKVPPLENGDVIECGINFTDNYKVDETYVEMYFLKQGKSIAKELVIVPQDGLYPSIWINDQHDIIKYLID